MAEIAVAAILKAGAYFAANAAQIAITTALTTVANLALKPDAPEQQGALVSMELATTAPRRWQAGLRGNGGVLVDWFTTGHKNQNLTQIIYLGEGPMGRVMNVYAQGRNVYSSPINNGQRVELVEFRSPDPRCYISYFDGTQTVAPSVLTSGGFGWPSSAYGMGCAFAVVEMIWDPDTMPFPANFFFELEGAKFYDRRKDSTAGGSGTHRHRDPTTWELTKNPAVIADHYKLGKYFTALDARPSFGIGLPASKVPYDRFAANANLCDEDVTVSPGWQGYGGTTQKRYEANGIIFADRTHKAVLNDLGRAMNARAADLGGKITYISNEAKAPVLTIDESDLLEETVEQYSPKNPWSELINGVRGTYQDKLNNYNPDNYPQVLNSTYVTEDGGEEKFDQLDLPFETDPERAQRLATLYLEQKRQQATLTGTYPLWTIELQEGDWFTRTGGRFGAGKTFEVMGAPLLDPDTLLVNINAREVDPSNSAWDNSTATTQNVGTPSTAGPTQFSPPVMNVTAFSYDKGSVQLPSIRFENTEYQDAVSMYCDIQLAESDGQATPGPTGEVIGHTMQRGQQFVALYGLLPSQDYVWRVRQTLGTRGSDWSAWTELTTTAGYQTGAEITSLGWSQITNDNGNRPDDNADVTGDNVASGIVGQGWGATASQSQADNSQQQWGQVLSIPTDLTDGRISAGLDANGDLRRNLLSSVLNGSNILQYTGGAQFIGDLNADLTSGNISAGFTGQGPWATSALAIADVMRLRAPNDGLLNNPFFSDPTYTTGVPPDWANWANGGLIVRRTRYAGTGVCAYGDATVSGRDNLGLKQTPQVINPNGLYRMRIQARRTGGAYNGAGLLVQWLDSAGAYISGVTLACAQIAPIGGGVSAYQDGLATWDQIVQAPANAARANVYAMWSWTGMPTYTATGSLRFQGEIHEANLYPATDMERRSNTQEDGADVTGNNVAGGIVSQGWGATAAQSQADNNYVQQQTANNASMAFTGDHTGALDGGQVPRYNQMTRTVGSGTNVTNSTTWSIQQAAGCTASVSSAGVVTVSGITANGQIVVRGVYSGVTIDTTITTSLTLSPPPVSGGSSSAGTSASDSTLNQLPAAGNQVVVSDRLTVSTGGGTTIAAAGLLTTSIIAGSANGALRNAAFYWRYRLQGQTSWTNGTTFNTSPDAEDGTPGGGFGFAEPGSGNVNQTFTGLSIASNYEFELVGWLTAGATADCFVTGTVSVTGT